MQNQVPQKYTAISRELHPSVWDKGSKYNFANPPSLILLKKPFLTSEVEIDICLTWGLIHLSRACKNIQHFTLGAKWSFEKDNYAKTTHTHTYTDTKTHLGSEICTESRSNKKRKVEAI